MGGWATTITQDVKLTPQVAKKAIAVLPRFAHDFNEHLNQRNLPNIKIGPLVGSTAYIDLDIAENRDVEYGDIDVIMYIQNTHQAYWEALENFVMVCKLPYIYEDLDCSGHDIIVKIDEGWVQIDLITSVEDGTDWTQMRLTPERGASGTLLGRLYTALAETINLSINNNGV